MCSGAVVLYGIERLVMGENSTFVGGEAFLKSRGVEVVNLDLQECKDLMATFIKNKPEGMCSASAHLARLIVSE